MIRFILLIAVLLFGSAAISQSLEIMAGDKRIFADIQWLKAIDKEYKLTLFSRSRATVDYDNITDLFTGGYFNYTTKVGLGPSLVGRIGKSGGGADAGMHIFKNKKKWMLYGLASVSLQAKLQYSWFSIFRYTPAFNDKWKLYTSLELFSVFNKTGHTFSTQRVRLGASIGAYDFGLAGNISEYGTGISNANINFGAFIKKSFD